MFDDIRKDYGLAVIDPHGDLIADVLQRIPQSRTNDVILFDPAEHPIAFNPLACSRPGAAAARRGRRALGNEESVRRR